MKPTSPFPLFQSHLDLAHSYWKHLLSPNALVIDATCGNGHDSLVLANLVLDESIQGSIILMDIQEQAIEKTRHRLTAHFSPFQMKNIQLICQCHSYFPAHLQPESVNLIVYNLGYLPGGAKTLTTQRNTTLQSLQKGLSLIHPGGALSITCYPGHEEGKYEEEAIKEFASTLEPAKWSCCRHIWLNRNYAPSLLIIQKSF